jgi:hypothetical protein
MRKAVKTMMGISRWMQERREKKILRKKEQAYQQLLVYCQEVINQQAAAKRYIITREIIKLLILRQIMSGMMELLVSTEITNKNLIAALRAALEEIRKEIEKILEKIQSDGENTGILGSTVESAEVESDIGKAKAEIAVPKAKIKLEEKEEKAA